MIDHDAKPGPLLRCQVCGSPYLLQIIDLGHQPPCDALRTAGQIYAPELTYPLRLNQCQECSLAQLDYVVPAADLYPASYPYRAGISWPVVAAHKAMAAEIVERFGTGFVVDIGSNDGTLLKEFKALGCHAVGVEPTNIADFAIADSVDTVKRFFCESVARDVFAERGPAAIVTMTNVFAHMGDLGEVMRGVCALLAPDGVLVVENHYLLDILESNQFDSIYHEHVRTYTLKSLIALFDQYGLEVFDVHRVPRYGGNIRVYVGAKGQRPLDASVGDLLHAERAAGLYAAQKWWKFRGRVYQARDEFMAFARGREIVGCSAPGRASTLLNFYGVDRMMMPWTGELEGSQKIGKYIPGCHVPIVSNRRIIDEQPEYLALLAWHYAEPIAARLRNEGVRSKLLVPLPKFAEYPQTTERAAA